MKSSTQGTYCSKRLKVVSKNVLRHDGEVEHWEYSVLPMAVVIVPELERGLLMVLHPRPTADESRWEFVSGSLESEETPVQAAIRELKEEVGLLIEPSQLSLMSQLSLSGNVAQKIAFFYVHVPYWSGYFDNHELLDALVVSSHKALPMMKDCVTVAAYGLWREKYVR